MIVENIMSRAFSTLKNSDSEDMARQLMIETGVSYLVVIGNSGELLGIIWQTDFLQRLEPIANRKSSKDSKSKEGTGLLSNVMRVEYETISSSSLLRDVVILLQQNNCDCLLVVADNRLIGIVVPRNFLGVTIDLLEYRGELKFGDMCQDTEIRVPDEDDLGDIFIDKSEPEDWNQLGV